MGADGVGLFQDDVAMDVKAAFDDALAAGLTAGQAVDALCADPYWREALEDTDDGPVTWLALAALLLREGALRDDVRDQATRVIASGAAMTRWDEAPNLMRMARERVLERFSALLAAGTATPEELQAVAEPRFRRRGQP